MIGFWHGHGVHAAMFMHLSHTCLVRLSAGTGQASTPEIGKAVADGANADVHKSLIESS